jgi:uncharacterized membrane protein YoaT (DUF817 family)
MGILHNYHYILIICLLVSLLLQRKALGENSYLKLFSPFLLAALAVEIWTADMSSKGKSNVAVLDFFSVVEFCFYFLILSYVVNSLKARKIIRLIIPVYAIVALANIIFFQGMDRVHTVTYSLGCVIIVAICIYYFLEIFTIPKSGKLMSNPGFWICVGLLLFYCCTLPMIGLVNSWSNMPMFLIRNFGQIIDALHIFLYSSLTIANYAG